MVASVVSALLSTQEGTDEHPALRGVRPPASFAGRRRGARLVTIERDDMRIQPPFEVYEHELYCAACRLDARNEPAETFEDVFGDIPAWQVRKGRR
jgi:hypothetical protein